MLIGVNTRIGIVVIGISRDFFDDLLLMQHLDMSVYKRAVALSRMGGDEVEKRLLLSL